MGSTAVRATISSGANVVPKESENNTLGNCELNHYISWIGRLRKKYENQQKQIKKVTQNIKKVESQIMELTNEETVKMFKMGYKAPFLFFIFNFTSEYTA